MRDPSLVDDALEQALRGEIDVREDERIGERRRERVPAGVTQPRRSGGPG